MAGWGEGNPGEVQPGFKNSLNLKCCESFISLRFSFMVLFLDDFDILVEAEDGAGNDVTSAPMAMPSRSTSSFTKHSRA